MEHGIETPLRVLALPIELISLLREIKDLNLQPRT